MKKPLLQDARKHFHYESALRNAKDRAMRDPEATISLYYDGVAIFVKDKAAVPPRNSVRVCDVHKTEGGVKVDFMEEKITWTTLQPKASH